MKRRSRIPLLLLVLALASSALATTTTIYFSTPAGDLGTTHNYTFGTATIAAAGFNGGNLYGKNEGGDEDGLGLTGDPAGNFEIFVKQSGTQPFIQLDLLDLLTKGYTNIQFAMSSTQFGDGWRVSACATSGTNCLSFPTNGTDEFVYYNMPANFGLTNHYLDFSAVSNNVLVYSIRATDPVTPPPPSTPEPGGLILLSTGLLGVAQCLRKFRK